MVPLGRFLHWPAMGFVVRVGPTLHSTDLCSGQLRQCSLVNVVALRHEVWVWLAASSSVSLQSENSEVRESRELNPSRFGERSK